MTLVPSSWRDGDPVDTQLRDLERQGTGMATFAHICASLLLLAGSLGSLISISAAAFQHFLAAAQAGRLDVPDLINTVVGVLLVLAGDAALLYAASILRVLHSAQAPREETRIHFWVLVGVSAMEAGTYLYMAWLFDPPTNWLLFLIDVARALAWPLLCAYLSMARPIPVGPRDVAYQAALASGKGVVRDVAVLAADPSAPLERKVRIFRAASTMTAPDRAKFDGIIEAVKLDEEAPSVPPILPPPDPESRTHTAPDEPEPEGQRVSALISSPRKLEIVGHRRNNTKVTLSEDDRRTMAFALLDANPEMSRNSLRAKMGCRAEKAAELHTAWRNQRQRLVNWER